MQISEAERQRERDTKVKQERTRKHRKIIREDKREKTREIEIDRDAHCDCTCLCCLSLSLSLCTHTHTHMHSGTFDSEAQCKMNTPRFYISWAWGLPQKRSSKWPPEYAPSTEPPTRKTRYELSDMSRGRWRNVTAIES